MRVTRHADKRMRQRIGINRSAVQKLASKAMSEGYTRHDFHGSLRRYLDSLYHYNNGEADNIRVWGEKVWLFSDTTLITVFELPQRYKNRANGKSRKESVDDAD